MRSPTKLQDAKNNIPKENKMWKPVYKFTDFHKSHYF